ncbi:neutral/alkaline ceramidase [Saccharomonospora azurea]|uniref:Neutral ceramidase n=1 Tax=Saccharomonospora azurea NA-128 TaxID=882081 RepID=H8G945_9PSEU|nr:neutral/alkaline ceramidase [Saccharomonospora azurea]EHY90526.1 Neutral/alkaline non-lysosomal ceramidase [Saccharomonospora azurea NA-128]
MRGNAGGRRAARLGALATATALVATLAGTTPGHAGPQSDPVTGVQTSASSGQGYLVGRGVADATGEIAEVGMMGYGRLDQQAEGLHTRLRARSFVIVDQATDARVLLVVVDSPMIFSSVHQEVLDRLADEYGDLYDEQNVLLTATHTHSGPGGYAHHLLYNITTLGFHSKTFDAIADGILDSVRRAHDDLAPSTLRLTHAELTDASANRSHEAFGRNPEDERAFFPDAIDPQTTLLRVERQGEPVGAINWFPTHNTSMSGDNRLISADNKGYAAYHWERRVEGVDYLDDATPDFVAAFAQTNAGDMSPNLDLTPSPTPEDRHRTAEIGLRQYRAAAGQLDRPGTPLRGGLDAATVYIDLSDVTVRPEFTSDGREHRTCDPAVGAAMAAGSTEDGPAFPLFAEGDNPLLDAVSDTILYEVSPALRDCQAPKAVAVPIGAMNDLYPWVTERVPVQLVRIGSLHLIAIPGEVTISAGLRLRQTVAEATGADVRDVLVAGYSNGYAHYVTTPEEYDAQHYEGGSTLFGRWELDALRQTAHELATALRDGTEVPVGTAPPDLSDRQLTLQPGVILDTPVLGTGFGDVLTQPRSLYLPGERATAVFSGAHPGNDLHRGSTYVEVQRWHDGEWQRVADDGDWSTTLEWARRGISASTVTVSWDVPADAPDGTYRIRYHGDAKELSGTVRAFTGTSAQFRVATSGHLGH